MEQQTLVAEDLKLDASTLEAEADRLERLFPGASSETRVIFVGDIPARAAVLRERARKLRELATVQFPC